MQHCSWSGAAFYNDSTIGSTGALGAGVPLYYFLRACVITMTVIYIATGDIACIDRYYTSGKIISMK